MKKYLKYLSPIGLDLLLTIIGLMIIGSDQSISIIIIFFFMLAAAISLVVAIVLFFKKKWVFGTLWVVNMLLAPVVMMGACKLCYSTTHAFENRSFVCYNVQATRWKTNFHNFELELKRHSSKCTICSFDERYVGGGYSGSSDWHHGTYSTNPDGSYQITNDTTITYVYQQKTNPDPCPETVAKNVFSRKTTKVSYKVKGE